MTNLRSDELNRLENEGGKLTKIVAIVLGLMIILKKNCGVRSAFYTMKCLYKNLFRNSESDLVNIDEQFVL